MSDELQVFKTATLSDDGVYRYRLGRVWEPGKPRMVFIMLNPSTADAAEDDPTIRRCISFAQREGAGGIVVVNLYAYRSAKPDVMWGAKAGGINVIGGDNNVHIRAVLQDAVAEGADVVAAWGAQGDPVRSRQVVDIANEVLGVGQLVSLETTKEGLPGHPLYQSGDTPFRAYPPVVVEGAESSRFGDAWAVYAEMSGSDTDDEILLEVFLAGWTAALDKP